MNCVTSLKTCFGGYENFAWLRRIVSKEAEDVKMHRSMEKRGILPVHPRVSTHGPAVEEERARAKEEEKQAEKE